MAAISARTSVLWTLGSTFSQTLTTLPVGEMRKVSRAANFMSPWVMSGNTVGVDDLVVGVGKELEAEGVFRAPCLVAFDGVEADAEDDRVEGVILGHVALEVVGFDGASLGLVLRVEVEDDPLAFVVGEADGLVFLRGQGEVGCGGTRLNDVCRGRCMGLDAEAAR